MLLIFKKYYCMFFKQACYCGCEMGLLEEKKIDTDLAISIYAEANKKANKKAEEAKQKAYGADEIATELEKLLSPILMEKNLLDKEEYSRIEGLINQWDPKNLSNKKMGACASIQQVLLGLLPICKQQQQIKTTVSELKNHLENKIGKEMAFIIDGEGNLVELSSKITPKNEKLAMRYKAIFELDKTIKDKSNLSAEDIEKAKKALKTCLNNKPEWSERPFLQKLTDVLSIGFKPLYRAFFSKEKELEKKLENDLSPKGPN